MGKEKRLYWQWAVMVFGVGSKTVWEKCGQYDGIENFCEALMNGAVSGLDERTEELVRKISLDDAAELLRICSESGQRVSCFDDEDYPERLKLIQDPPAVIYRLGSFDIPEDRSVIAISGARQPSDYSLGVTEHLCRELAKRNTSVVTGCAEGIDQTALLASAEAGGIPVGVVAGPLGVSGPKLTEEFIKTVTGNGVMISEYYPGCKANTKSFAARNRISVGLSQALVFVECAANSRGLNNYEHARAQGKPVLCVPPRDILDSRYFGQRDLIRNGCAPMFSVDDIAYATEGETTGGSTLSESYRPAETSLYFEEARLEKQREKEEAAAKRRKSSVKKADRSRDGAKAEPNEKAPAQEADISALTEAEREIWELLRGGDMSSDGIALKTGREITEVLEILTSLELKGLAESLPGKRFGLA